MDIGQIVTLVVFVATIIGAVLYLRADARAIRQEFRNGLAESRAELNAAMDILSSDIRALAQRVTALETRVGGLEARVEALDTKIDTRAAELSAQMQRNHRELLIRLAFHHHGDGRYPASAATDPEPVDPAADNE